jgi:signal transduction histidine kinase
MMRRGGLAPATQASPALFRWECGPGGEIAWVDGAPRGALIGRSIARPQNGDGDRVDPDVVRAFTVRAPFRDAALTVAGDGLVSGDWKISGVPAFDPADGRFRGYRGVALREQEEAQAAEEAAQALSDPDSLRELVHEIKTPLNAIIGFAEIIEGQYLGPADRRYRERAQEIVRQARLLLVAIDDLDFAAKVHSSTGGSQRRVNLSELVEGIAPALRDLAGKRRVELDDPRVAREATAATEPELADRLIFRMCSALIEQADAGERLRVTVERAGERWRLSMSRPERLAPLSEDQLLGGEADSERGFSLRLVSGLARIAGAELVAPKGAVALLFPRG